MIVLTMNNRLIASILGILLTFELAGADFQSVRTLAQTGKRVPLTGTLDAYVISDCASTNTETCPNLAGNIIAISESLRTIYIQNEDGSLGMRMKLSSCYGNNLHRGDKIKISLEGGVVLKEDNPERYTLESIDIDKIQRISQGNPIASKHKLISELKPEDIYTFVTLEGLEFFKKEGGYINVFERAVQITSLNKMLSADNLIGYPSALECVDAWPTLMLDKSGNHIYMVINSTCEWRRNNMGVPQGIGNVSGVIVNTELCHYGNSLGDYAIRPMVLYDIDIEKRESSSYEELCAWHWDFNKYIQLDNKAEFGNGEFYVSDGISMSLDDEYDARHSFDGWKSARMTGSRSNAALRLDAKCSAWYEKNAGLFIHTSLKDVKSRDLLFCFSFVAGRDHSKNSVDYPVDWRVSYSLDGEKYVKLPATFDLRPIVFTNVQHGKRRAVLHNGLAAGFTEHCVSLPAELAGQENVTIKISVASDRTATMPEIFDGPCREGKAKDCSSVDTIIRFGDISIKSLKQ